MTLQRTFILRDETTLRALGQFIKSNWLAFAQGGKPLAVTVNEHKKKRSNEQNKRLWSMLNEIAEQAWVNGKRFSADAWHEHFKRTLIGMEELPDGSMIGISTTTLNVSEFGEYMEKIASCAASEFGIEFHF